MASANFTGGKRICQKTERNGVVSFPNLTTFFTYQYICHFLSAIMSIFHKVNEFCLIYKDVKKKQWK